MKPSLRRNLFFGICGSTILLLAMLDLWVYLAVRHALVEQFDQSLLSTARMIVGTVEFDEDQLEPEFDARLTEFETPGGGSYYQVWSGSGAVLVRSPSLKKEDLPFPAGATVEPQFAPVKFDARSSARMVTMKFIPRRDSDATRQRAADADDYCVLVVHRDFQGVARQLASLGWILAVASMTMAGLSFIVATVVVRRGLKPLHRLAGRMDAVSGENLSLRFDTAVLPDEIAPIIDRLNGLLARLEFSFQRERQLTADIAHELRTPLAGLLATLDVTLVRDRDSEAYRQAMQSCRSMADNMQFIVNNLLALARLESGRIAANGESVPLHRLLEKCWTSFAPQAAEKKLQFENHVPESFSVHSSMEYASIVANNLLNNAVTYANPGGQIRVAVHNGRSTSRVLFLNTGCELSEEQVGHVFDRFWRADPSRTDTGVHCGLGLALVKRIVNVVFDGEVTVCIRNSHIFALSILLPPAAGG